MKQGKVYLIGAGPGDPELLTLKGKRCLEEADVVVGDYLADKRILQTGSYCGPSEGRGPLRFRSGRRGNRSTERSRCAL